MKSQKDMDEIWEEYQHRDDNSIEIDGTVYCRILDSYVFSEKELRDERIISVIISPGLKLSTDAVLADENGNHFLVKGFEHLSFRRTIPEWYIKAGPWMLCWIETPNIGKYLRNEEQNKPHY